MKLSHFSFSPLAVLAKEMDEVLHCYKKSQKNPEVSEFLECTVVKSPQFLKEHHVNHVKEMIIEKESIHHIWHHSHSTSPCMSSYTSAHRHIHIPTTRGVSKHDRKY